MRLELLRQRDAISMDDARPVADLPGCGHLAAEILGDDQNLQSTARCVNGCGGCRGGAADNDEVMHIPIIKHAAWMTNRVQRIKKRRGLMGPRHRQRTHLQNGRYESPMPNFDSRPLRRTAPGYGCSS